MNTDLPLLPPPTAITLLTADDDLTDQTSTVAATCVHSVIQRWAAIHGAEPATGEETSSGAASAHVTDGGAGIRFNFPGVGRFRPISWEEWLEHFDRHALAFVFERPASGQQPRARYRLVKFASLKTDH